tara:strand:+ start:175 stop:369 length:195 start_codon:yes stop_codon:yes gene_type:complete
MNRRKQLKMIENYIQKHGVKRLAADQRGNDEITRDGDLKLKKLKVQLLRERNKRNRAFKLLNED